MVARKDGVVVQLTQMSLLARSVLRTAAVQPAVAAPAQARNMATLREIELRLKSVRNIEKITKVCSGNAVCNTQAERVL